MKIRMLLRTFIQHFFTIYALSMIVTPIFCGIFSPDAQFSTHYFWQMMGFSLLADLPLLLYYSPKELSRRQWMLRSVAHTIVLECALMYAGFKIGLYAGFTGGVALFISILAVDCGVRLLNYLRDRELADAINRRLRDRRNRGDE